MAELPSESGIADIIPLSPAVDAIAPPVFRRNQIWTYFGPAFVASVAYIDPGNFATNIQGGSSFGYRLLWVLLWSNAMAILIQYLSAKLGIVTGRTLPQNCRDHFSRPMVLFLWVAAEISAIATDLAGFRFLEWGIMGFVAIIGICYAFEVFLVHPDWRLAAFHTLVPEIDHNSLYIAVGMLGATVMPHVIYLHSALVQPRLRQAALDKENSPHFIQRFLKFEILDVFVAMNGAWLINSAMILMAAVAFGSMAVSRGLAPVASIEDAHQTLVPLLGGFSALIFAVALLCSGLASSTVGVMAGQVIIEGFLDIKFPIFLRRFLTIIPAIAIIAWGLDPLKILILSQVVLSFTLPFALIPLLILTGRSGVMKSYQNMHTTQLLGWVTTSIIIALNAVLLWQLMA